MEIKSLEQITSLLNCKTTHCNQAFTNINIDSRTIQPGELFWALKGERVDGHMFLKQAFDKGAIAAVVDKSYTGYHYNKPLLVVEDTLHAIQECVRQIIKRRKTRIVAITGSLGKTTVKEFTKTLLHSKYSVFATPGNYNSQVGIPLSILNHSSGKEEILILEMGMTTPGNITRLTHIAPPEVAAITNISLVHACNFDSLEGIALAKSEIFSQEATKLGIIPFDTPYFSLLSQQGHCHKLSASSQSQEADYFICDNIIHSKIEKKNIFIDSLPVPGKHNRYNFLVAATIARHFNVSWEEIIHTIPVLELPDRRLQFIRHKGIHFLNDSYNAAEASVKCALETLPLPEQGGRKIAVLGSMMELGKFSIESHTRVGEHALKYVDSVFCLGEECLPIYEIFKKAGKDSKLFFDRSQLVEFLRGFLKPSDVVLLKGSCSKELWKVLEEF